MLIQSVLTVRSIEFDDAQQLQSQEFPVLIDFWLPLRDKVLARFAGILEKHAGVATQRIG